MTKWKDETRNGKIVASAIKFGRFRLSVHHYIHCGGTWFASAAYIFDRRELSSEKLSDAKVQAVGMLQVVLEEAHGEMLDFFNRAR